MKKVSDSIVFEDDEIPDLGDIKPQQERFYDRLFADIFSAERHVFKNNAKRKRKLDDNYDLVDMSNNSWRC